jgi:hypothetical protein
MQGEAWRRDAMTNSAGGRPGQSPSPGPDEYRVRLRQPQLAGHIPVTSRLTAKA